MTLLFSGMALIVVSAAIGLANPHWLQRQRATAATLTATGLLTFAVVVGLALLLDNTIGMAALSAALWACATVAPQILSTLRSE